MALYRNFCGDHRTGATVRTGDGAESNDVSIVIAKKANATQKILPIIYKDIILAVRCGLRETKFKNSHGVKRGFLAFKKKSPRCRDFWFQPLKMLKALFDAVARFFEKDDTPKASVLDIKVPWHRLPPELVYKILEKTRDLPAVDRYCWQRKKLRPIALRAPLTRYLTYEIIDLIFELLKRATAVYISKETWYFLQRAPDISHVEEWILSDFEHYGWTTRRSERPKKVTVLCAAEIEELSFLAQTMPATTVFDVRGKVLPNTRPENTITHNNRMQRFRNLHCQITSKSWISLNAFAAVPWPQDLWASVSVDIGERRHDNLQEVYNFLLSEPVPAPRLCVGILLSTFRKEQDHSELLMHAAYMAMYFICKQVFAEKNIHNRGCDSLAVEFWDDNHQRSIGKFDIDFRDESTCPPQPVFLFRRPQ